jgi:alkaline phosphatase D
MMSASRTKHLLTFRRILAITMGGFVIGTLLLPQLDLPVSAQEATAAPANTNSEIVCEGRYRHHLQGVCRGEDGQLFWSFTTTLVKTNANGKRTLQIEVPNHHGDVCYRDGKIYVAVNRGSFNHPEGMADNWIYVYRGSNLELLDRKPAPQVKHGAGGIAHDGKRFIVVGGLPEGVEENYVYEYDDDLAFVKKHVISSGYTRLGIQTATFSDNSWWFGCYGNTLLKTDPEFVVEGRYEFDCGLGIESIGDGQFLVASGACGDDGCSGVLTRQASTDSLQSSKVVSRVHFGSCIKQQNPAPIFKTILAEKPELFLFVGDNIYADTTDMNVMRQKYTALRNLPGFTDLMNGCRVLATWDDHDYGVNDGGNEYDLRNRAQQVFVDFWKDPLDSPRRQRPGVYEAHKFGPSGKKLQIVLLDTRYFRGPLKKGAERRVGGPYIPTDDKTVPMLGDEQWKWLDKQLRQPADFRIIVTSIQCIAEDAGQETWTNLPHERQRFLKLLSETGAKNVLLLSGDRHWSELSMTNEPGFPLYELTSSSLNQVHPRGTPTDNKFRHLPKTYHLPNYGEIDIDWKKKRLNMKIVDDQGKSQFEKTIGF